MSVRLNGCQALSHPLETVTTAGVEGFARKELFPRK
jgi:hypothetical protein